MNGHIAKPVDAERLRKPFFQLYGEMKDLSRKNDLHKMIRKGGVSYDYVTGAGCSDDSEYVDDNSF